MKTLPRVQAEVLWGKYWNEMRDEWFKLEVLQDYSGEDEGPSLESWLKDDKDRSIELMRQTVSQEWVKSCQEKLKQGVKLIRIHVVEEPYSLYIEWELQHYKYVNIVKCGEQVYLVNRSETSSLDLPGGDMMIFDKKWVVTNSYNSHGLMTHETFYDESDDISQFLEIRKKLIGLAKPLRNFV